MSYPVRQQLPVAVAPSLSSAADSSKALSQEAAAPCSVSPAAGEAFQLAATSCLRISSAKYDEEAVRDNTGRIVSKSSSASTVSPSSSSPGSTSTDTPQSSSRVSVASEASSPATTPPASATSRCTTPKDVSAICGLFAEPRDVRLLVCMLNLCGLLATPESDVAQSFALHPRHLEEAAPEAVIRLVLRALEMLRKCKYSVEDISVICAHATVYFKDAYRRKGDRMDWEELGNVLVLSLFLAHSYALDCVCPLHIWHRYLFEKYCSLKDLDAAVIRILELRKWALRVEEPLLHALHEDFCQAASGAC